MKALSDCTVLVVDDTEANVDILVDALGELYDVSVAMDGREAMETVADEPPDLILLDIMMPEMDGYEVCQRLKGHERYAKIPIIFLTALTEIENKTKGFQLGAVDYITKPFEIAEVKARVQTHLKLALAEWELQDLVVKTLGGAIEVLTEILSVANPTAFSRTSRLKRHANALMAAFNLKDFWQIRMAAMLSQIGCIAVSPDTIEKIFRGQNVLVKERERYDRHPQIGYELIRKIPRLTEVAEIIARQQDLQKKTGFKGDEQVPRLIQIGSQILKLVLAYEKLTYSGKSSVDAMTELKQSEGEYSPKLLEKFSQIVEREPQPAKMDVRKISPRDVTVGMVLAKDIITSSGSVLVKAGTQINPFLFEILHNSSKSEYSEDTFEVFVPA
ncbi:MAG: response regulator [Deltaproteobacteria bacterium]|jgi:response regulator RpfG family c-di-GMP phosphodiesterase|nr:response regulator [Deltaproteobacteria bacterium]